MERFDVEDAVTVLAPEHPRSGFWVGCPSVVHEPEHGRFLMTYRQRRPRGEAAERGWRCAIASSSDGVEFTDIWSVEKDELGTSSMERFALVRHGGRYLLYVSYVDPADNRWRIDVAQARTPDAFDLTTRVPALTAAATGTEGVKDPVPVVDGSSVRLFVSYAAAADFSDEDRRLAHERADIYVTDMTTFPTGLAVSEDGLQFSWTPDVFPVGAGWDRYQARLTTVVDIGNGYVGLYDGSRDASENYEERTGLAVSADLASWTSITPDQPWRTSPHSSGSVRYGDIVEVDGTWFVYFEYARPDGAHELRLARVPRTSQ
ncbi:hypothetical protein E1269_10055 [Jiangella asiatica]|uniref:Glycosyl hydrolase family 32 N-terminal domain-containing protein n=1 Tax=Jiangella asiatica TaxID=2530372 RepID=A0A4V2Z335_9ACTN|nr:hypothetical protein E1269_10055 [Jiangella asiatica]